jgi:hypothetical protein
MHFRGITSRGLVSAGFRRGRISNYVKHWPIVLVALDVNRPQARCIQLDGTRRHNSHDEYEVASGIPDPAELDNDGRTQFYSTAGNKKRNSKPGLDEPAAQFFFFGRGHTPQLILHTESHVPLRGQLALLRQKQNRSETEPAIDLGHR